MLNVKTHQVLLKMRQLYCHFSLAINPTNPYLANFMTTGIPYIKYCLCLIFILYPIFLIGQVTYTEEYKYKKLDVALSKCNAEYFDTFNKRVEEESIYDQKIYRVENSSTHFNLAVVGKMDKDLLMLFANGIATPKMFLCDLFEDCTPPEIYNSEFGEGDNYIKDIIFNVHTVSEIEALRTAQIRKYKITGDFNQLDNQSDSEHVFYIQVENLKSTKDRSTRSFLNKGKLICLEHSYTITN